MPGMIALLPDAATAERLAVIVARIRPDDVRKIEHVGTAPEQLHLTLAYLGDDMTAWSWHSRDQARTAGKLVAQAIGFPLDCRAFAHATFNPDGYADREPCAAYLIGDNAALEPAHHVTVDHLRHLIPGDVVPTQHAPFIPHVTAGYGITAPDLSFIGPARFDRVAVAIDDEWTTWDL